MLQDNTTSVCSRSILAGRSSRETQASSRSCPAPSPESQIKVLSPEHLDCFLGAGSGGSLGRLAACLYG